MISDSGQRAAFDAALAGLAPLIAKEPRPRPTLRIGATGHRVIQPQALEEISWHIADTIAELRRAMQIRLAEPDLQGHFAGAPQLVLVSPMAEGADRLIAEIGRQRGCRLAAVLPFAQPAYEQTFDLGGAAAVEEFRRLLAFAALPEGFGVLTLDGESGEERTRDAAYLHGASKVTQWSDMLMAVLDRDRWGSITGQGVRMAISAGIPALVFDPQEPSRPLLFSEDAPDGIEISPAVLMALVRKLMPPPSSSAQAGHGDGLLRYVGERVSSLGGRNCDFESAGPYVIEASAPLLAHVVASLHRKAIAAPSGSAPSGQFSWQLPLDRTVVPSLVELFLRFHRADTAASAYAHMHRASQLVVTALSALAVGLGALSLQEGALYLDAAELATLFLIVCLVASSHRHHWLDRWLEYRLVAELLRCAKYSLLAGVNVHFSPFADQPEEQSGRGAWSREHARALLRAMPICAPSFAEAGNVHAVAEYVVAQGLEHQIRYHEYVSRTRRRANNLLRRASVVLSGLTLSVCVLKFVNELALHRDNNFFLGPGWVQGWSASLMLLSALTAAAFAVRTFGEHEIVGERSQRMMDMLKRQRSQLCAAPSSAVLGAEMIRLCRLLLQHAEGWRELFASKHLES